MYWHAMLQKLPGDSLNGELINLAWMKQFIKSHDEDIDKGYILEPDVVYPKHVHDLQSDLPFLSKRMKIKKSKLICNLYNKKSMLYA